MSSNAFRGRPTYDAADVLYLVESNRVGLTKRVASWLVNHGYPPLKTARTVVQATALRGSFIGKAVLFDGASADEYHVECIDAEWYVKFAVYVDGPVLRVYSCCWDGAVH